MVADDLGAELQFADVEKAGALGKVVQQRAGDHRHVPRRGVVLGIVQTVRVDEMQFVQADLLGLGVHLRREGVHRARHALGDGHGDVVGRLHHQHLEGVVEGDLGAGPEAHLRGRLARRAHRDDERRVHGQPAGPHRVERDIDRHQLGQRRGIPDLGRVLLDQHLSAVGVDDEIGSGAGGGGGQRQRGGGQPTDPRNANRHAIALLRRPKPLRLLEENADKLKFRLQRPAPGAFAGSRRRDRSRGPRPRRGSLAERPALRTCRLAGAVLRTVAAAAAGRRQRIS